MRFRDFKLERYFGEHEFTAKILLSSSDPESLTVYGRWIALNSWNSGVASTCGGSMLPAVNMISSVTLKRKLKRENHLAEIQQVVDAAASADPDDQYRRDNRQDTRDHPAEPRLHPPVHEAFHDHLSGERAGDGARLSAREKGDGK